MAHKHTHTHTPLIYPCKFFFFISLNLIIVYLTRKWSKCGRHFYFFFTFSFILFGLVLVVMKWREKKYWKFFFPLQVEWRKIDSQNHLNSTKSLNFFLETLFIAIIINFPYKWLDMVFIFGERKSLWYSSILCDSYQCKVNKKKIFCVFHSY